MLLDTSGLLNLIHQDELHHEVSQTYFSAASQLITHNYVLAEFVALANSRHLPRQPALAFVSDIADSDEIEVVWVSAELHRQALILLADRVDKQWSLCDAVSFVLMQELHIREALTTDHHFEQAGFVKLLT